MNKLDEIVAWKREEIATLIPRSEKLRYAAAARNDFRSFSMGLNFERARLGLIAEVKKASPSAGIIAEDFDPVAVAKRYDQAGVGAISVLTDQKYFKGDLSYLTKIRNEVNVPVLRKDFIVHEAQIYEAVVAGADAILLIVACLSQEDLVKFLEIAHTYQLEVLVEVHDEAELERALNTEAKIIGINNRNLKTFEVQLEATKALAEEIPDDVILVSESGIKTVEDAHQVFDWGADAVLVGESLMRSSDPIKMAELFMNVSESSE